MVCALAAEEAAARRAGARVARVGLGATGSLPEGPLVSFGLAGALAGDLVPGTLVTATRIVDDEGRTLWEGLPAAVAEAREVVVWAASRIVDDRGERLELAARSGAQVVDLESGPLAASGRLVAVLRAISDTPEIRLGQLALAARPEGGVAWAAVLKAFATEPVTAVRTAGAARKALAALERAAVHWSGDGRLDAHPR